MARAEHRAQVVPGRRRASTRWEVFRVAEPAATPQQEVRPARTAEPRESPEQVRPARTAKPEEPQEQVRPARALAKAALAAPRKRPGRAGPAGVPEAATRARPLFARVRPTAIRARFCHSGIRSPTACNRGTTPVTARTCSSWRSRPIKS